MKRRTSHRKWILAAPPGGRARRWGGSPCPSSSPRPAAALALALTGGAALASGQKAVVGRGRATARPLCASPAGVGSFVASRLLSPPPSSGRAAPVAAHARHPPAGPRVRARPCSPSAPLRFAPGCAAAGALPVALGPLRAPVRSPFALLGLPAGPSVRRRVPPASPRVLVASVVGRSSCARGLSARWRGLRGACSSPPRFLGPAGLRWVLSLWAWPGLPCAGQGQVERATARP